MHYLPYASISGVESYFSTSWNLIIWRTINKLAQIAETSAFSSLWSCEKNGVQCVGLISLWGGLYRHMVLFQPLIQKITENGNKLVMEYCFFILKSDNNALTVRRRKNMIINLFCWDGRSLHNFSFFLLYYKNIWICCSIIYLVSKEECLLYDGMEEDDLVGL
jgi:hypothetical protein